MRRKRAEAKPWVDPDDAPELTEEWFERATLHFGGVPMKRGQPLPVHVQRAIRAALSKAARLPAKKKRRPTTKRRRPDRH